MVFIRPTFEVPNCARGMLASPSRAQGMLVAHKQFVIQMPIHELVDVAQILQQLPCLAERRSDQLDQRLGEIRRDVLVGERCAERGRMPGLRDRRPRERRAAIPFRRLCGRRAARRAPRN